MGDTLNVVHYTFNLKIMALINKENYETHDVVHGMLAGLIGGLAFSGVMALLDPKLFGKVAALYDSGSEVVGFILHLIHSMVIGGLFGAITRSTVDRPSGTGYGMLYGTLWWVLGPVILYPVWMDELPITVVDIDNALTSMPGHLIYGLVLGYVYVLLAQNERYRLRLQESTEDEDGV